MVGQDNYRLAKAQQERLLELAGDRRSQSRTGFLSGVLTAVRGLVGRRRERSDTVTPWRVKPRFQ